MVKADIPLLLNTDGGVWPPDIIAKFPIEHWIDYEAIIGEGYFIRCKGMADLGISPMDIILSGTRNVASAYHKLGQLGTLEKGKLADLVILNADPLADIDNLRSIFLVIKDGKIIDREKAASQEDLISGTAETFLKTLFDISIETPNLFPV